MTLGINNGFGSIKVSALQQNLHVSPRSSWQYNIAKVRRYRRPSVSAALFSDAST
jgi:hypothetical protein